MVRELTPTRLNGAQLDCSASLQISRQNACDEYAETDRFCALG